MVARGDSVSKLPEIGQQVQLFGVGCEGCGGFRGSFTVRAVQQGGRRTRIVVTARRLVREGPSGSPTPGELALEWDARIESWRARCGAGEMIVSLAGHYRGPGIMAA